MKPVNNTKISETPVGLFIIPVLFACAMFTLVALLSLI